MSFLPIGRLSGEGTQLEISAASPLGAFVGERFGELWRHGRPLAEIMATTFTVTDSSGAIREYTFRFVCLERDYFLAEPQLLAQLALTRDGSLRARVARDSETVYEVQVVDGDSDLQAALVEHYDLKYERLVDAFVRLIPLDEPDRAHTV